MLLAGATKIIFAACFAGRIQHCVAASCTAGLCKLRRVTLHNHHLNFWYGHAYSVLSHELDFRSACRARMAPFCRGTAAARPASHSFYHATQLTRLARHGCWHPPWRGHWRRSSRVGAQPKPSRAPGGPRLSRSGQGALVPALRGSGAAWWHVSLAEARLLLGRLPPQARSML